MPSGGARVGAGRPRKNKTAAPRQDPKGPPGGRTKAAPEPKGTSPDPPSSLSAPRAEFWRLYAPHAIAAGTLTPQTEGAWHLLCELVAEKDAIMKAIEDDGRTVVRHKFDDDGNEVAKEVRAHPLIPAYRALAQRVEQMMARFALAPMGKAAGGAAPKATKASPWETIDSRRK